jgi:hypothetical protein
MVAPTAIMMLVSVEDHIPPLVGSRNNFICWNPSAVSSTSAMRPKTNIKVVIENMKILGGEDKKPGLRLRVSFSQVSFAQVALESVVHISQKDVDRHNIDDDVNACGGKQTMHDPEAVKKGKGSDCLP